jgi:hypothetical protein
MATCTTKPEPQQPKLAYVWVTRRDGNVDRWMCLQMEFPVEVKPVWFTPAQPAAGGGAGAR